MANYQRIVGNWASAAQRGRQRAEQNKQNKVRAFQIEQQAKLLEQQNEMKVQNHLDQMNAQAEELAKQYRPQDLEKMKTVAADAEAEIKSQLEFYGDDLTAFMRGGRMQHLKNYSDTVLMSDEAKTIRHNHKALTQYLDVVNTNPHLVSAIDHQGFQDWQSGKNDAFIFHGQYLDYDKEGLDINQYDSVGEAYLSHKDNHDKALFNYLLDTNQQGAHVTAGGSITDDMLINYLNTTLGGKHSIEGHRDEERISKANSVKASQQIQLMNESLNRGFQGDFNFFWESGNNPTVLENLRNRAGGGTFDQVGEGAIYGTRIFYGQEKDFVSSLFNIEKKDLNSNDMRVDLDQINKLIQHGGVTAYDTDGNSMSLGETFNGGYDEKGGLEVMGFQYGLKVTTDRVNGKTKLLTYDDVTAEGNGAALNKNKAKDGVVTLVLKDQDGFWRGKDDYIYIEIDMNNANMAKKFDDVVGDMDYKAKTAAEVMPGQYTYEPGKKFNFTGDNPRQAVSSLHTGVTESLKTVGIHDFDPLINSAIIAHSLSYTQDKISPQEFIQTLTTSQDPIMQQAVAELKEGDIPGYLNVFKDNNIITKKEVATLQRDMQAILNGYRILGEQSEQ